MQRTVQMSLSPRLSLTASEVVAGGLVGIPGAIIATAYLLDLAGWSIDPGTMLVLLLLEIGVVLAVCRRQQWYLKVRLEGPELAGFATVAVGMCGYLLWIAYPSFLPLALAPDVVHHATLVDFIYRFHGLPHDPMLNNYLGECLIYSPGSHILAALLAAWLGTAGLRVLHPLLAVMVSLKAGIVYSLTLRVLPAGRQRLLLAGISVGLLLLAPDYLMMSFMGSGFFYAQVVSETFAIAMLWTVVAWDQQPSDGLAVFFAGCGIALFLTWPQWLPMPVGALCVVVMLRRDLALAHKLRCLFLSVAPIALVVRAYTAPRLHATGILNADGGILAANGGVVSPPRWLLSHWALLPCLLLLIWSLSSRRTLPIALFVTVWALETAALFAFDAHHHVATFYEGYKMFYLLPYPVAVLSAAALDSIGDRLEEFGPYRFAGLPLAVAVAALVLLGAIRAWPEELRTHRLRLRESIYECGLWVKSHLPGTCVDYGFKPLENYWVHVEILGNPRRSSRADSIEDGKPGPDLPYVIGDFPGSYPVALHRCGLVAVVQRAQTDSCPAQPTPIDQLILAPRRGTLAAALKSLASKL
jgi:hypothetical protein